MIHLSDIISFPVDESIFVYQTISVNPGEFMWNRKRPPGQPVRFEPLIEFIPEETLNFIVVPFPPVKNLVEPKDVREMLVIQFRESEFLTICCGPI